MFIRVYGVFAPNFCAKKAPRSSRLVLGCTEPRPDWVQNRGCSHVPSRLKGIETHRRVLSVHYLQRSHVPSRLKGIETAGPFFPVVGACDVHTCLPVWRELKLSCHCFFLHTVQVHTCLPVWRELKLLFIFIEFIFIETSVHTCLPVWRELKLWVRSTLLPVWCLVHTCLPVWRELKLEEGPGETFSAAKVFTRAFPFEGNCNASLDANMPLRFNRSHVPSRLKGIETWVGSRSSSTTTCSHVPSRLKGIETSQHSNVFFVAIF